MEGDNIFFKNYCSVKSYWLSGIITKRIGRMTYTIKNRFEYKRHVYQIWPRYIETIERNDEEILWGQAEVKSKLCYRFLSESILRLFYLYPTLSCWCILLEQVDPKRIIQCTSNRDIDSNGDVFFPLFSGFNNHSMGEGIFPEYNWNGWIPKSRWLKIR